MKNIIFFIIILLSPINSQNFWEHLNGPSGASISAIIRCSDGKILAKANNSYNLYASTDAGESWSVINNQIYAVSNFVACVDGRIYSAAGSQGLLLTTNDGVNWQNVSNGLPQNTAVYYVHRNINGDLFVGTYKKGLFRSTDNGSTFTRVSEGLPDSSIARITNSSTGTLYVAINSKGIFKSPDYGTSWIPVNQGLPSGNQTFNCLYADAGDNIYVTTAQSGLFKSTNQGATWSSVNIGLPYINAARLIVQLNNGALLLGTASGIYRSTDGAQSWQLASLNFQNYMVYSILYTGGTDIYVGGVGFGILKSTDSGTDWEIKNQGMVNASILSIVFTHENEIISVNNGPGILFSSDNGLSWQNRTPSEGNGYISDLKLEGGVLYYCCQMSEGGFFYSSDKGLTWVNSSYGLQNAAGVKVFLKLSDSEWMLGSGNGLYISVSGGQQWSKVSSFPDLYINELFSADGINIFASTLYSGVYRSSDAGLTWNLSSVPDNNISKITASATGHLYAAGYNSVYKSTDSGITWLPLNNGLQNAGYLNDLIFVNDNEVYTAGNIGVFYSSDGGNLWTDKITGMGSNYVATLALSKDKFLYAGTAWNGIYRSVNPLTSVKQQPELIPSMFAVSECFPNPFNPGTGVEFFIPSSGTLNIVIFDAGGREVASTRQDFLNSGKYLYTIDLSQYASGTYFLRSTFGQKSIFRKLLLVK